MALSNVSQLRICEAGAPTEVEVVGMRAPLLVDLSHSFVQKPLVLPEPLRGSNPLPKCPLEDIHRVGILASLRVWKLRMEDGKAVEAGIALV